MFINYIQIKDNNKEKFDFLKIEFKSENDRHF